MSRILSRQDFRSFQIPDFRYFLEGPDPVIYPYQITFSEGRYEPFVILHTSGSTGIPKPVVLAQGTLATVDAYQLIRLLGGKETIGPSLRGKRLLLGFPLFHAAGLQFIFGFGVYYGVIIVIPPAQGPLTAEVVDRSLSISKAHTAALPPSLVVDLYRNPNHHENVRSLDCLLYAGGPLPDEVGSGMCHMTELTMVVGATEYPLSPLEPVKPEYWQYVKFSRYGGCFFRPCHETDVYEQVFVKEKELELFQGIFATFPNLDEYSLNDLYQPHPTEPGLWRFRGRTDDLIIFTTAEKLNPTDMETLISSHPAISSALVGGHGKSQSCLLVEPEEPLRSFEEELRFLDEIWPIIERANQVAPSYGRVMRDFVVLTHLSKPPVRAGKGTVQRTATLQMYKEEIDQLYYNPALPGTSSKHLIHAEHLPKEDLMGVLGRLIQLGARIPGNLLPTTNLLDYGLDSWKVVAICKHINAFLLEARPDLHPVEPRTIYEHPTIKGIELVLKGDSGLAEGTDRAQEMQAVYNHCLQAIPQVRDSRRSHPPEAMVILLTGSSGSLGSYILKELFVRQPNARVYCLNRTQNTEERQTHSFTAKGISPDFPNVTFLVGDVGKSRLGLEPAAYEALTSELTTIIHNAWKLDFNQSLDQYAQSDLRGVGNLLNLAAECNHQIQFDFISTTSAIRKTAKGQIMEQIEDDWSAAQAMGYAESNLVAERLVAAAAKNQLIDATISRVGQMAGPTTHDGVWPEHEWFPTLVACSSALGKLPESLGTFSRIDWIPVDVAARVLLELFLPESGDQSLKDDVNGTIALDGIASAEPPVKVFHVVNPSETNWADLVPLLMSTVPTIDGTIPYTQWLTLCKKSLSQFQDNALSRVALLLPFFDTIEQETMSEPLGRVDTTRAWEASLALRALGPVSGELLGNWVRQWELGAGLTQSEMMKAGADAITI